MTPGHLLRKGTAIYSRDGERGETTGAKHSCQLTGCRGIRITVRWPDGSIAHPCSKGISVRNGQWQIG